jgi:hypothetical protein
MIPRSMQRFSEKIMLKQCMQRTPPGRSSPHASTALPRRSFPEVGTLHRATPVVNRGLQCLLMSD